MRASLIQFGHTIKVLKILVILLALSAGNLKSYAVGGEGCVSIRPLTTADRWPALKAILASMKFDPKDIDEELFKDSTTRYLFRENMINCSYDPGEMDTIDKILAAFSDPVTQLPRSVKEINASLDAMSELEEGQRGQIKFGVGQDIGMTQGGLTAHSCRATIRSQIQLMNADPAEMLKIISDLELSNAVLTKCDFF